VRRCTYGDRARDSKLSLRIIILYTEDAVVVTSFRDRGVLSEVRIENNGDSFVTEIHTEEKKSSKFNTDYTAII